jgi:hypothetical protein
MKQKNDPRQMFLDFRVRLEPDLQPLTEGKSLAELESLLKKYRRFAHQIEMKMKVMILDLGLPPFPRRVPIRPPYRRCPHDWN